MVAVERKLFVTFDGLDSPKSMHVCFSGLRRYGPPLIAVAVSGIRASAFAVGGCRVQGSGFEGAGLGV